MNRNKTINEKAFPAIDIRRCGIRMRPSFKTTFNTGELFPICEPIEVYPSDTFSVDMASLIRMATPQTAVMDNATFDTFAFFVPMRLVWEHTKQFFGEKDSTNWDGDTSYQIPQYTVASGNVTIGSLFDHFGITPFFDSEGNPASGFFKKVSALPFRAYQLIYNEWFRNQQLQQALYIPKTDNGEDGGASLITLRNIGKFHDMFVDALPEPQFGDAVQIPIGALPIYSTSRIVPANSTPFGDVLEKPLRLNVQGAGWNDYGEGVSLGASSGTSDNRIETGQVQGVSNSSYNDTHINVYPYNLWAVGEGAFGGTINDLRYAFAIQRMLERENYGGTRYTEIIRSFFGVISPDGRLQRPEYLGGARFDVNMSQTVQVSSTDSTSPQGNVGGLSKTVNSGSMFTRSFTEHGMIIILGALRTEQTYQAGLNKYWLKKDKLDFYNPVFANIGNQPILKSEIALEWNNPNGRNDEVFGYQEAYYDLRFMPSKVSGYFRSGANGTLDAWHYAEDITNPILGETFIKQGAEELDRTLAISKDTTGFQFFADFYLDMWVSRALPQFSYPGLVDHF